MALDPAPRWLRALLLLAIAAGVAALLPSAWTAALHCDETNVFRHVTRFQQGDFSHPGRPGLLWLLLLPLHQLPDLASTVRGYRLASVLASFATLYFVAGLALRPRGDERAPTREGAWGALAALALLVTSGDWRAHAFEVRTDTYVIPLTLGALALLLRPHPRRAQLVVAGGLLASAGLISQKSVFGAAAIGIAWAVYLLVLARPLRPSKRLGHVAIVAGTTAALMAAWFVGLGLLEGQVESVASSTVQTGMVTAFRSGVTMDDKVKVLVRCLEKAPWVWALALASVPLSLAWARRVPRALAAAVISACMLGTIWVHSGFRVYYVASFEPYMVLAAAGPLGLCLAWLHRRAHAALPLLLLAAVSWSAWSIASPHQSRLLQTHNRQSLSVLADVEELFPDPVPYWDGLGLLPGYTETTFLNTGPTRTRTRRIYGKNAFITLARLRKPQFFVRTYMSRDRYMRPDERRWHWTHFLPLRDNLYVAGGRIKVKAGKSAAGKVEILTPGPHRVWFLGGWTGTASLDGVPVKHGDVVQLTEATHRLEGQPEAGRGELWLILGTDREPERVRSERQVDWSFFALDWRSRYGQYDRQPEFADLLTPRNDPSMTDGRWTTRKRRHRDWQKKRQQHTGSP